MHPLASLHTLSPWFDLTSQHHKWKENRGQRRINRFFVSMCRRCQKSLIENWRQNAPKTEKRMMRQIRKFRRGVDHPERWADLPLATKITQAGGRHSTEVALALLTQQPRVRIPARIFFLITA